MPLDLRRPRDFRNMEARRNAVSSGECRVMVGVRSRTHRMARRGRPAGQTGLPTHVVNDIGARPETRLGDALPISSETRRRGVKDSGNYGV